MLYPAPPPPSSISLSLYRNTGDFLPWVLHLRFLSHSTPAATATHFLLPRNLSQSESVLLVFFIVYKIAISSELGSSLSHSWMYCQQPEQGWCISCYSEGFYMASCLSFLTLYATWFYLCFLPFLWACNLRPSFLHPWITSATFSEAPTSSLSERCQDSD